MKDNRLYVLHILNAIGRIEQFTHGISEDQFCQSILIQDAVIRNIQVIGEASKKFDDAFCNAHPHIPWRQIGAMRNKLVHEYFGVDLPSVWSVVIIDLPVLKQNMLELKSEYPQ
ncbi:MAG: DUF86 domain-containing protein [Cyclobacteriaceae bacterium]|jgi:uncharacterized protein with HEPN domain|nr:DUF86 domain-containing protein [Flammeovirgaceae bacterium]